MADKKTAKYLVQGVTKSTTKGGKTYLRLQLFDATGKAWPGIYWEDHSVTAGQVIDALVEESDYQGTPQLTVHALRVLDGAAVDEFLPRTKYDVDEMWKELNGYVLDVGDVDVCRLLSAALDDPRWRRAPAAKTMHHAFIGGLLQHVLEMCRISRAIALLYPVLRLDLLIAGCVLHDIGKLSEYGYDGNISITDQGEMLGHISIGFQLVGRLMDRLGTPSLDEHGVAVGTRMLVEHIILSHHGQKAYGSPVTPMFLEAAIFNKIDGIGADMARMTAAIERAPATATWAELPGFTKEKLYLGEVKK